MYYLLHFIIHYNTNKILQKLALSERQHFTQLNSNNPGTKSSTEIKRVENKAQTLTLGNREVKESFKRNVDNCTSWQREGAGALLGAAKAAPRRPASSNPFSPNRTQTGLVFSCVFYRYTCLYQNLYIFVLIRSAH